MLITRKTYNNKHKQNAWRHASLFSILEAYVYFTRLLKDGQFHE